MKKTCIRSTLLALAVIASITRAALAAGYDDKEALAGLKEVKVAFRSRCPTPSSATRRGSARRRSSQSARSYS